MMKLIEPWLFHRRAMYIARKLIPLLLFFGKKTRYSKEEVDYAIERSKLSKKHVTLAYAIYCVDLSQDDFHRSESFEEYLSHKCKYDPENQRFDVASFAHYSSGDCTSNDGGGGE
ncbi:hypothetical protein V9R59_005033 [Vibrio harveyi]|uniref:DUF6559 family protein n=1 Tax=Vibrio harveyi TaxID=669 RepID=UPI003CF0C07F|nr:hypothetical protein [Vibrio harveyi]